jgi:hypothetical protein
VHEKGSPKACLVLEASFNAQGKPIAHSVRRVNAPSPFKSVRLVFRSEALAVEAFSQDGKVFTRSGDALNLRSNRLAADKVPPVVISLRGNLYVLELDAVRGLRFVELN